MSYSYVMSPEKLREFLKRITGIGVPPKASQTWLKGLGYTSTNDRRMLSVLEFIGLVGSDRVPTALWRKELRANLPVALGTAIRQGYADLYSQYPDAHKRDDEALRTFFAAHTDLGSAAVGKIVGTFKALCRDAEFDEEYSEASETTDEKPAKTAATMVPGSKSTPAANVGSISEPMTVNINVQLQVPPDATGEIYDKFFEAMRKHLWPQGK